MLETPFKIFTGDRMKQLSGIKVVVFRKVKRHSAFIRNLAVFWLLRRCIEGFLHGIIKYDFLT